MNIRKEINLILKFWIEKYFFDFYNNDFYLYELLLGILKLILEKVEMDLTIKNLYEDLIKLLINQVYFY
jgi:hypothetical protein